MSTTDEKSTSWSAYFNITLPEDYSFFGYYKYRSKQTDFTSSFKKETHKLKKDLENLIKDGSDEKRKGASRLEEIRRFEVSNSIIQDTIEVFKNSISSVNSTIKNVNNTVLKYNGAIKGIENIKPNSESVLGKRQNFGSSDYDSSTESDGNEMAKKKQARKKAESITTDNNSDGEELANTLGYDGLAFLFNDSNEDAIMGKIDENTLEEESKLPLASDNKDSSKFIREDVLNAFRKYQNKIPKTRKVFTPAYWGVLDLTRESLYECKEISENDLQQLSQDFANHVKWECEPAPINIQNYFDSHCEKLDNSDENEYFDTNVQFLKINMHSFQGMLTEEQLKMTSSFPLFNGIFTSNRMKHAWGEIHSLSNSDARNEKSNPYKKSRMGRKVDMKVTLLKTPNKFEALFGEVAGGLGPFGVPTACRKKRFLDKLKLMVIMRDSINRLLKECDHVSDDERLEVIVYGWLQFGLELNFYAMDWRGSGVYRFGLLDRCRIPVDDNYCNILEDAYCILKLLEKKLLDTEISVNKLFLNNTRGKRRQIVLENKAELNIT
ncbi:11073_t:CDS:2, partial [Acaulospora morrowiae]